VARRRPSSAGRRGADIGQRGGGALAIQPRCAAGAFAQLLDGKLAFGDGDRLSAPPPRFGQRAAIGIGAGHFRRDGQRHAIAHRRDRAGIAARRLDRARDAAEQVEFPGQRLRGRCTTIASNRPAPGRCRRRRRNSPRR
jgi:hypothetical protein